MRKVMIAGNWKMHLNTQEASLLVHRLNQFVNVHRDIEIVLAPSLLSLQPLSLEIDRRKFRLAAQNAYFRDSGPFTGEVSFTMLRDLVQYVIVGHSERRIHFDETLEIVREKVAAAVRNDITPILCIGETLEERQSGLTGRVLNDQLTTAFSQLTPSDVEDVVIAYEPVWAIGEGEPGKPYQIEDAIGEARLCVRELYGAKAAKRLRVLYGGSVEAEFVRGILSLEGVDGFLVGGASLNYRAFVDIIDAAYRFLREQR